MHKNANYVPTIFIILKPDDNLCYLYNPNKHIWGKLSVKVQLSCTEENIFLKANQKKTDYQMILDHFDNKENIKIFFKRVKINRIYLTDHILHVRLQVGEKVMTLVEEGILCIHERQHLKVKNELQD